jgi:molybdopterin molybdotransferase
MIELEEARQKILDTILPLPVESIPLAQATGRFLAEPILSPIDLPSFDNSAMDGYAVRAEDVKLARPDQPMRLTLSGKVTAGEAWAGKVDPGTCARVFTGSILPAGANAVVMQEDTRLMEERPDQVEVLEEVKPWENVRLRGEDIKSGMRLFEAGDGLTPGAIGLLAAVGVSEVRTRRQPKLGLIATGNELQEAGEDLGPGRIYESNRACLAAWLTTAGAEARVYPLVPDTLVATKTALAQAFGECDGVVTTGGVSVGELDLVKAAFAELGGEMQFWKVAVRPGKPFVFGRRQDKFFFGLPGNPVSAVVTFLLLVRPAVRRWQGARQVDLPSVPGQLAEPLVNRGERRHFMRVKVDNTGAVRSAGPQGSHHLGSLAVADGLVDVPPRTTLPAGTPVRVWRWVG